ncbi:MAG: bifunctional ornithine acetyltransferase/N-acetylglutamate synthase, partial [Lachnospiraceae bacterium]|nr:bifunctional ornithine acetyltransferase/N-acetylglutamate synthase [Lachnospiraceae bacterium]
MRVIDGGITAPQGFKATGKHIGIKKIKKDLALLSSDVAAEAAGIYTTSLVKAAPILWNKRLTDSGKKIKGLV